MLNNDTPSFEEQCRLGQKKYQTCTIKDCEIKSGIAFNRCWDCTRKNHKDRPETQAITDKEYPNIGGSPIIFPEKKTEEECIILTFPKAGGINQTPKPEDSQRRDETSPEEKKRHFIAHAKWGDMTKEEQNALQEKYEVYLI